MGILDFLRKKKDAEQKGITQSEFVLLSTTITDEQANAILEEEIRTFFPDQGHWSSNCFRQSNEVCYGNLPCHLRDNDWLSNLLQDVLDKKGIYIPKHNIKSFIDNSKSFEKLRHAYELRIVEWQIKWIQGRGEGWLVPKGYDEIALLFSEDVDIIIRGGVLKTLQAIGMNKDVIEEGLERFADIWRPTAMRLGFEHLYEPVEYVIGNSERKKLEPVSEGHKKNWLADREYQYYQTHRNSVDKYGVLTPAMKMTPVEHAELLAVLTVQNSQRNKIIEVWKNNSSSHSPRNEESQEF